MRRPPWDTPPDPLDMARELVSAKRRRRAALNAARAAGLLRRHAAKEQRDE